MSDWLPRAVDLLGYGAGALVLLAFSLRSLIALRSVAIASNVMFIAYAVDAHLQPVLVLHAALLPVNVWRLRQCIRPAQVVFRYRERDGDWSDKFQTQPIVPAFRKYTEGKVLWTRRRFGQRALRPTRRAGARLTRRRLK